MTDNTVSNHNEIGKMKTCTKCGEPKPLTEYYYDSCNNNYGWNCKVCRLKESKAYYSTLDGRIQRIMSNARQRCRHDYAHKGIKFMLTASDIENLWHRDKGELLKRPSLDRKDNNGDYTLENCQFIELLENIGKDRSRAILKLDMEGKFIAEYKSATEAGKSLGKGHQSISAVANGREKSAHGFIWRFRDIKNPI